MMNPPPGYRVKSIQIVKDDVRLTDDVLIREKEVRYTWEPENIERRRRWAGIGLVVCGFAFGFWLAWLIFGAHWRP